MYEVLRKQQPMANGELERVVEEINRRGSKIVAFEVVPREPGGVSQWVFILETPDRSEVL